MLKLAGVQAFKKTGKDGRVTIYYRDRRTGMSLGTSRNEGQVLERHRALHDLKPKRTAAVKQPGSYAAAVQQYRESTEWLALAESTRELWQAALKHLETPFGPFPLAALTREVAGAAKMPFIRKHGPAGAKNIFVCARAVWTWFRRAGFTDVTNPFSDMGKFETREQRRARRVRKRQALWRLPDVQAVLGAKRTVNVGGNPEKTKGRTVHHEISVPDDIRLALLLGFFTCQRQTDILDMRATAIVSRDDGLWIQLDQSKTDQFVGVPVHPLLREELERQGVKPGDTRYLIPSPIARTRFRRRTFSRRWTTWTRAAGVSLHFQALRRSGMVWLAELGVAGPQIAAISGHSIERTGAILEEYIPRTEAMAAAAMRAWSSDSRLQPGVLPPPTPRARIRSSRRVRR